MRDGAWSAMEERKKPRRFVKWPVLCVHIDWSMKAKPQFQKHTFRYIYKYIILTKWLRGERKKNTKWQIPHSTISSNFVVRSINLLGNIFGFYFHLCHVALKCRSRTISRGLNDRLTVNIFPFYFWAATSRRQLECYISYVWMRYATGTENPERNIFASIKNDFHELDGQATLYRLLTLSTRNIFSHIFCFQFHFIQFLCFSAALRWGFNILALELDQLLSCINLHSFN